MWPVSAAKVKFWTFSPSAVYFVRWILEGFCPHHYFPFPTSQKCLFFFFFPQQKCLPSYLTMSLFFHPAQPPELTFALKGVLGQLSNLCSFRVECRWAIRAFWWQANRAALAGESQCACTAFLLQPSHLWHKGLTEPYNALCSHRHLAAQAVLQTLVEKHRREIFCPSLVYTALSVANVSQTRQVHLSHADVPAWARKSPQHQPKHNHSGTELQGALPATLLTTTWPVPKHSHRSLKHSSGVGVKVWGGIS